MAFDEKLASRMRTVMAGRPEVAEKKMFGGLAILLDGKMFCGIVGSDLMVRVGRGRYEEALRLAHVRPMDFTGRPLAGYVYVSPAGCRGDALAKWIRQGAELVASLPQKKAERKPSAGRNRPKRRDHTAR